MAEFTEVAKIKHRLCKTYKSCECCRLSDENNGYDISCVALMSDHSEEYERICLEWAKENPEITNADKFFEVFGYELIKSCVVKSSDCSMCKSNGQQKCNECKYQDFWDKPYIEPKGGTE